MSNVEKRALLITCFALPMRSLLLVIFSRLFHTMNEAPQFLLSHISVSILFTILLLKISPFTLVDRHSLSHIFTRKKEFLSVLFCALIYILSYTVLTKLFNIQSSVTIFTGLSDHRVLQPLLFLQLVIIAPVAEELFFRGHLLKTIEAFSGNKAIIISISSLFFMAVHSSYTLFDSVVTLILGVVLAWFTLKYRSISSAILLHGIINFSYYLMLISQT